MRGCIRLKKLLLTFSALSTLMWSLIGQNTRYLSFRCFMQLRLPVALTIGEHINLCICYIALFLIVVLSVCIPFFMKSFGVTYRLIFDQIRPRLTISMVFISAYNLFRLFTGFCHAYLHDDYSLQVGMLALSHSIELLILTNIQFCFLSKSVVLCFITRQAFKAMFFWMMLVEAQIV